MFQRTAVRSLASGGWLTQFVVVGLVIAPAVRTWGQEVRQAAAHLGPTDQTEAGQASGLQWQKREPTPAKRPNETKSRPAAPRRAEAAPAEEPSRRSASPTPARRTDASRSTKPNASSTSPSRTKSWRGTLIRNPNAADGGPTYAVVDHLGLKQRYLRTQADVDLDRFVDRDVTVLSDTGLILDLDQVELAAGGDESRGRVARAIRAEAEPRRFDERLDDHVEVAAYDEPAPRFQPGDSTVRAQNTTSADAQDAAARVEEAPTERVAQRIEQLPLTTPLGQPLVTGENIVIPPVGGIGGGRGGVCPACGQPHGSTGCVCGARGTWFGRAEYLYWWTNGFDIPPLVTTSTAGTPQAQAGVLDEPTTSILLGNREIVDGPFHGARFSAGRWLGGADKLGVAGDYLALNQESFRYSIFGNNGSPIIARPFFNVLTGAEDASLVAFPGVIEGTATVEGASDLEMAGLRLRIAACCSDLPTFGATSRVDFLTGYRFAQLDEQLYITEDSISEDPENPGSFLVRDAFLTHNEFHGGEAGVVWELDRPRFALELVGRIAIGTNQQDVIINGSTTVSDNGFSLTQEGGLLAQRTNIGHYERNRLSVMPQLSANVSFKVTRRLRLTAGYTFLYWSRVVRPGDQIELDVNPNLFPPEAMPFTGAERPRFAFRESDFWAHGASAGVDYRF